jgi:hypothetical protein
MTDEKKPPRRRVIVEIKIGADSEYDAYLALRELLFAAQDRGNVIAGQVTGGPRFGYSVNVDEDQSVTHISYFDELERFLEREKKSQGGEPPPTG